MHEGSPKNDGTPIATRDLLGRIGMLTSGEEPHRSNPLSDPPAFRELASRLAGIVDEPYDLIVVRDLFGDRVLGYQLALISGTPVTVSYDQEGIIVLGGGSPVEHGSRALIAADTHLTTQSIRAAASGVEQAGVEVVGVALLLQAVRGEYPFPVWALERYD